MEKSKLIQELTFSDLLVIYGSLAEHQGRIECNIKHCKDEEFKKYYIAEAEKLEKVIEKFEKFL